MKRMMIATALAVLATASPDVARGDAKLECGRALRVRIPTVTLAAGERVVGLAVTVPGGVVLGVDGVPRDWGASIEPEVSAESSARASTAHGAGALSSTAELPTLSVCGACSASGPSFSVRATVHVTRDFETTRTIDLGSDALTIQEAPGDGHPCSTAIAPLRHDGKAAVEPSVFDRLQLTSEVPRPKPPDTADERATIERAKALRADELIPAGKRPADDWVPLRGTIAEYVAAVVSRTGRPEADLVATGFVPCGRRPEARCVALVGDPCRKEPSEGCEGMYLTVVVDPSTSYALDRAVAGGRYVVENQGDIEDLRDAAP